MKRNLTIFIIFVASFLLRIYLSIIAYHGDLNNNISWGKVAFEEGLNGFYELEDWKFSKPNQPPLTILLFGFCFLVWKWLRGVIWYLNWEVMLFPSKFVWFWDDKGLVLLIKLPSILADLAIACLLYRIIKEGLFKKISERKALIAAFIWLFNPVSFYNSSIWGQTDSIVNFLGLTGIYNLFKNNLPLFVIFISLSILFKGSLLIFTPLLFYVLFIKRFSFKDWLVSLTLSLSLFLFSSFPFHPSVDLPFWLASLYRERILPGEIGYLTANAFNLWWLVDSGKTLDSKIFYWASARTWGFILFFSTLLIILFWLKKKVSNLRIIISLSLISFSSFLFLTRIHERYLYPFFPLATILFIFLPKIRLIYIILSIIFLLNMYNLFWAPSIKPLELFLSNSLWFTNLLAFINLTLYFFLCFFLLTDKKL